MKRLNIMYEIISREKCSYCREINPTYFSTTFDFTKDVESYSFSIKDSIECDLKKVNGLIHYIMTSEELNGFVEFKTEDSTDSSKDVKKVSLYGHCIYHPVPNFSAPIKEIIFTFPKELNKSFPVIDLVIHRILLL